jgi:predicted nuclease of predicted toxin-antitoxin system
LSWAEREGRVVLTFDKDFGELAPHLVKPVAGVLHCSHPDAQTERNSSITGRSFVTRNDRFRHFSAIAPSRIRMGRFDWPVD